MSTALYDRIIPAYVTSNSSKLLNNALIKSVGLQQYPPSTVTDCCKIEKDANRVVWFISSDILNNYFEFCFKYRVCS